MIGRHETSLMMLAGAVGFYNVFGIIVPDVLYGSIEYATNPAEHATAAVGEILRKISPFIAVILGLYAGARFIKELGGKN